MNELEPIGLLRALLAIHHPLDIHASTIYCACCLDAWPCDHAAALDEALRTLETWLSPEEARDAAGRAFDAGRNH